MSVASTILEQLGGNKFVIMTGAKNFLGSSDHISFTLPTKPHYTKRRINRVKITLDIAKDTYIMKFGRYDSRKLEVVTVELVEDVYCEDLCKVFESVTGLRTRLF